MVVEVHGDHDPIEGGDPRHGSNVRMDRATTLSPIAGSRAMPGAPDRPRTSCSPVVANASNGRRGTSSGAGRSTTRSTRPGPIDHASAFALVSDLRPALGPTSSGTQPEGRLCTGRSAPTRDNAIGRSDRHRSRGSPRERRMPSPTMSQRASDLGERPTWWRGRQLNLRPSGDEPVGRGVVLSHRVPRSAAEQGVRALDVSVRTTAHRLVQACGVEEM